MNRWAGNTLRTLGIVLLGGFILVVSLTLLLCSLCAWGGGFGGGPHPDQGLAYLVAGVVVLAGGIWIEARLARSVIRSSAAAADDERGSASAEVPQTSLSGPLDLPSQSLGAINRLAIAMGAQIGLSAVSWFWNQVHYWAAPSGLAPHNWTLILLVPFILYHVPYAILIYRLLTRPNRRTFAYCLTVPSILILQGLFSVSIVVYTYIHHPAGFLLVLFPWLLHIVILVLAWKTIQQIGIRPDPASLLVAARVTLACFLVIYLSTPFFYMLIRR
jgi:hypothetical protein